MTKEEYVPKFKVGDTIRSIYARSIKMTIEEIKDGKYYTTIDGKRKYWPVDKQDCYEIVITIDKPAPPIESITVETTIYKDGTVEGGKVKNIKYHK